MGLDRWEGMRLIEGHCDFCPMGFPETVLEVQTMSQHGKRRIFRICPRHASLFLGAFRADTKVALELDSTLDRKIDTTRRHHTHRFR